MASKHLWIAELQDRDGKTVEYHSVELEPEHYASRSDFNRAMTSWSAFRQRERGNLKCNRPRNSRCKWAVSWHPEDDAMYQLLGLPEGIKHHKTIWDLYEAIGYNYKAKKYERDATVVAIDPGSDNTAEVTFEGETITKVRSLASEDTSMSETKPRGINNGLIHLDDSGFMTKDGQPVYVATGDGSHSQFVRDKTTGQYVPVETVTVAECVALGAGVLAEPASLEEANRLRAEVGLEPLLAQPAPEGFEFTALHPEDWQEPAPANEVTLSLADDKTAQYTVKLDGNSFTVRASDLPLAQQIADKVNAEPDIEAKKRIIDAEMRYYHSEQERLADAQRIKNAIIMPNDPRKLAKVRAHKLAVVAKHQKLLRKQEKRQKQRELQVKAFNGK